MSSCQRLALLKPAAWGIMLLSLLITDGTGKAISPPLDVNVLVRSPIQFPWMVMGVTRLYHPNSDIRDGEMLAKMAVYLLGFGVKSDRRFKGKSLAVFVFSDEAAGQTFTDYQLKHQHQMLKAADFKNLVGLWPKVSVCYLYEHGKGKVLLPSRDPEGWWQVKPLYDPDAVPVVPHVPAKPIIFSQEVPHEPSYITNHRLNQQVQAAQKDMNTTGLDLPPDTLQAAKEHKPIKRRSVPTLH